MFCASCGTKIDDGIKFCPNCGAEVGKEKLSAEKKQVEISNPISTTEKEKVEITGKRAGEVPLYNTIIGIVLFLLLCLVVDGYANDDIGIIIPIIVSIPTLFFISKAKKSIPFSVTVDKAKKSITVNEDKIFGKKEILLSQIKKIRIRKVKVSFNTKQLWSSVGEYFVIALDTNSKKTDLNLYFQKEEEFSKIKKLIEDTNEGKIQIEENLEIMNLKNFYNEK